jgi:hypothetical protein
MFIKCYPSKKKINVLPADVKGFLPLWNSLAIQLETCYLSRQPVTSLNFAIWLNVEVSLMEAYRVGIIGCGNTGTNFSCLP